MHMNSDGDFNFEFEAIAAKLDHTSRKVVNVCVTKFADCLLELRHRISDKALNILLKNG